MRHNTYDTRITRFPRITFFYIVVNDMAAYYIFALDLTNRNGRYLGTSDGKCIPTIYLYVFFLLSRRQHSKLVSMDRGNSSCNPTKEGMVTNMWVIWGASVKVISCIVYSDIL